MRKLSTSLLQKWAEEDDVYSWLPRKYDMSASQFEDWLEFNKVESWVPPFLHPTPRGILDMIGVSRTEYKTVTPEVAAWLLLRDQLIPPKSLRLLACKWAYDAMRQENDRGRKVPVESYAALEVAMGYASGQITKRELSAAHVKLGKLHAKLCYVSVPEAIYTPQVMPHEFSPHALAVAVTDPNDASAAAYAASLSGWKNFKEDLIGCLSDPEISSYRSGFLATVMKRVKGFFHTIGARLFERFNPKGKL